MISIQTSRRQATSGFKHNMCVCVCMYAYKCTYGCLTWKITGETASHINRQNEIIITTITVTRARQKCKQSSHNLSPFKPQHFTSIRTHTCTHRRTCRAYTYVYVMYITPLFALAFSHMDTIRIHIRHLAPPYDYMDRQ